MAAKGPAVHGGKVTLILARGLQDPTLCLIRQICRHNLADNLFFDGGVVDFNQGFNAPRQIAPHPIGG